MTESKKSSQHQYKSKVMTFGFRISELTLDDEIRNSNEPIYLFIVEFEICF